MRAARSAEHARCASIGNVKVRMTTNSLSDIDPSATQLRTPNTEPRTEREHERRREKRKRELLTDDYCPPPPPPPPPFGLYTGGGLSKKTFGGFLKRSGHRPF